MEFWLQQFLIAWKLLYLFHCHGIMANTRAGIYSCNKQNSWNLLGPIRIDNAPACLASYPENRRKDSHVVFLLCFSLVQVMVTNVTSLLKTVKAVEDEATRGTRALEATIEYIKQELTVQTWTAAVPLQECPCTKLGATASLCIRLQLSAQIFFSALMLLTFFSSWLW